MYSKQGCKLYFLQEQDQDIFLKNFHAASNVSTHQRHSLINIFRQLNVTKHATHATRCQSMVTTIA